MGRKNYVNLNSFRDVRLFLSRLINARNNGEIASVKYRDLIVGCKAIQSCLESIFISEEIEERLSRLEGGGKRPSLFSARESVDSKPEEHPEGH